MTKIAECARRKGSGQRALPGISWKREREFVADKETEIYHSSRMQISSPRSSAGKTVSGAAPLGNVHSPDLRS